MTSTSDPFHNASVILVTYNGWRHTRQCLECLLSTDFPGKLEVIVVDNGSTDETVTELERSFPTVRLIESGKNLGFGGGCNLGLAQASGEFFVLLNNDALMSPDQLAALLHSYQRLQLDGVYTARIADDQGVEEASCFRDISPADLITDLFIRMSSALRRHTHTLTHSEDEAFEISACSGAFCLFPKDLWHQTGGFDEDFFMYYEDMDFCRRARALGYHIYANAQITIQHSGGGSSTGDIRRARMVDTSQRHFYRKHYGLSGIAAARTHQFLRSFPRAIVHALLGFDPIQRKTGLMHAQLAWDALARA